MNEIPAKKSNLVLPEEGYIGTMAAALLAKISSRIKGRHVYNYTYTIGERITCEMEDNNQMSKNAISIYSSLNEKIGHVPETLAIKLTPLWKDWSISEITGKITGSAPEGTWTQGGGIEIPSIYNIVGDKQHKVKVRNVLLTIPSLSYLCLNGNYCNLFQEWLVFKGRGAERSGLIFGEGTCTFWGVGYIRK